MVEQDGLENRCALYRVPRVRIPPPPQIETSRAESVEERRAEGAQRGRKRCRVATKWLGDGTEKWAVLSLSTVVKIEDGTNQNPTIDTLSKIAKALGVGVDDLIEK